MTMLYVLCGLPGSGKSHWANAYAAQIDAVVVGSDAVRNDFLAQGQNPFDGDAVFAEVERRARAHLQADRAVILDATHSQRRYRRYAIDLAREFDLLCVGVWFDAPLETALSRNRWRSGDRFGDVAGPDEVIRDLADHFEPPASGEFDRIVRITG